MVQYDQSNLCQVKMTKIPFCLAEIRWNPLIWGALRGHFGTISPRPLGWLRGLGDGSGISVSVRRWGPDGPGSLKLRRCLTVGSLDHWRFGDRLVLCCMIFWCTFVFAMICCSNVGWVWGPSCCRLFLIYLCWAVHHAFFCQAKCVADRSRNGHHQLSRCNFNWNRQTGNSNRSLLQYIYIYTYVYIYTYNWASRLFRTCTPQEFSTCTSLTWPPLYQRTSFQPHESFPGGIRRVVISCRILKSLPRILGDSNWVWTCVNRKQSKRAKM